MENGVEYKTMKTDELSEVEEFTFSSPNRTSEPKTLNIRETTVERAGELIETLEFVAGSVEGATHGYNLTLAEFNRGRRH